MTFCSHEAAFLIVLIIADTAQLLVTQPVLTRVCETGDRLLQTAFEAQGGAGGGYRTPPRVHCSTKLTNAAETACVSQKEGSLPVFVVPGRFSLKPKKRPFAQSPRRAGEAGTCPPPSGPSRGGWPCSPPRAQAGTPRAPVQASPGGCWTRAVGPGLRSAGRGPPGRPGGREGRESSSQDFSQARNTPPNVPPPSKNENSALAGMRSSPSLASAPRTLLSPERVPEGAGPRRRAPGLGPEGNRSPPSASRSVGRPRPACGAPRRRPDPRPPGPAPSPAGRGLGPPPPPNVRLPLRRDGG